MFAEAPGRWLGEPGERSAQTGDYQDRFGGSAEQPEEQIPEPARPQEGQLGSLPACCSLAS